MEWNLAILLFLLIFLGGGMVYLVFIFDQPARRNSASDWHTRENEKFFDAMLVFLEHDEAINGAQEGEEESS